MRKKLFIFLFLIILLVSVLAACSSVSKLSFAEESFTVYVGKEITPAVKIRPKKAQYSLSVVNETVAEITENGTVKGLKEGLTVLKVTADGHNAESTLYVLADRDFANTDVSLINTYTVNFRIANYTDYGFETGVYGTPYRAAEGSRINVSNPFVYGYKADYWYTDVKCTKKYDMNTPITENITLYMKITPYETDYNVIDSLIVGLRYPNLPHGILELPETTESGETIVGIADEAFCGDETLKEVTIPKSYKTIGTSAFAGCTSLEKVTFAEGSELQIVGINAFGVCRDDDGKISSCCGKLASMNLPDTVTDVREFAFLKCSELSLEKTPPLLTQIMAYSFSETLIKSADLSNVTTVFEGGFKDCKDLESVTGTEKIIKCEKYAFDGTGIAAEAKKKYETDNKEPGFYAGTILFGIHNNYGTGSQNGKYHIKETTTLIADNALSGSRQSELSLYMDTDRANAAIDKYFFLGDNVFYKTKQGYPAGIFVVVGEGLAERYAAKYNGGDFAYAELFAEEERIDVVESDNIDVINWGTHILLYRGSQYYYDQYIPSTKGAAKCIDLYRLKTAHKEEGASIVRINMNAINGVNNLKDLFLRGVRSIAYMGISNCYNLERIFLTDNNIVLTEPEHALSIHNISNVGAILVDKGSYKTYVDIWGKYGNLKDKIVDESEYVPQLS